MGTIIILILWILFAVADAREDVQYGYFHNHAPTVWPRVFAGFIAAISHEQNSISWRYLWFAFILASLFWFVFELSRNIFKEQYFYYIGTTAKTDRLLKEYEFPIFFLRIFLIAVAFCLYYYDELLNY